MLVWIGSAMNLSAQIALGGIFWLIAICAVVASIAMIVAMISKVMNK